MDARSPRTLLVLALLWLATFGAASSGALHPPDAWYAQLVKPALTPPDWVFPLVWTPLYVCIALSATLAWRAAPQPLLLAPWALQLVANAAWSWLFFGRHEPGLALLDLGVIVLATALAQQNFGAVNRPAGWLLLPYLAWLLFAGWLNWELWRLNP